MCHTFSMILKILDKNFVVVGFALFSSKITLKFLNHLRSEC